MSDQNFIEYFWHYSNVVITDTDRMSLVFDEEIFFSETKNILHEHFPYEKQAQEYFTAFHAYLVAGVNIRRNVGRVNEVMKAVYDQVMKGNAVLNEKTEYEFSGEDAFDALEGIFTAFHDTSLRSDKFGRFDVASNPLPYDEDNLVIRLIYFDKGGMKTKLLKQDPPIRQEELIESKRIERISGNSNSLVISLNDQPATLEVTPHYAKWTH